MFKIQLDKGIEEGDVVRNALTITYDIVRHDSITSYMGSESRAILVDGLSDEDYNIHVAWLEMRARNLKAEYQTGEVTQRMTEKAQAKADAEKVAQDTINALEAESEVK